MRRFNPGNFYCGTTAEWTSCPRPVRHPDHMSGSGSDYWYGESGVVRYSDHWGSEVASCDWYLDGVARCSFDDHYGTAQGRGAGHALVLTRLQPARRPARLDQGRGVREAAMPPPCARPPVLLEAAGVAVDYTYMPEETE